jgi:hypothetical protein
MKIELLKKYEISDSDFKSHEELQNDDLKTKAQTIIMLFQAIENTMCGHVSPEEIEALDNAQKIILNQFDRLIERK